MWALDTRENRRAAETVWARRRGSSHVLSMTVFMFDATATAESIVVAQLESIESHHDEVSQVTPWRHAVVFGASASPSVRTAFSRLGFDNVAATATGSPRIAESPPDSGLEWMGFAHR